MGLVVVEHIDTGLLTLHNDTCTHAKRAMITHKGTPFWVAGVDHECKTCKPDPTQASD
jgi:hypothetical protein